MQLDELRALAASGTLDGFYPDIPNEIYHSDVGHSSSGIILAAETSLATYKAQRKRYRPPSEEMELGTAVHYLLLEPKEFKQRVTYYPDETKGNSKAARLDKADFATLNSHKIIIKNREVYDTIPEMVSSIHDTIAHSEVPGLLSGGESELSCFHKDEETGLLQKVRSDYLHRGERISVNFKTTRSIYEHEFQKSTMEWNYHIQTAYYIDILSEKLNGQAGEMHIICEKEPPYLCVIGFYDDGALDKGRELYRPVVRAIAEAERTGIWPAVKTFSLPHWAFYK